MSQTRAARAAVLRETGGPFIVEPVKIEGPRGTEVLVRVVGSGVCHTDIAASKGKFGLPTPCVLGHEGSGVVEAVGPDVTTLETGDHVVLTFRSCGHCPSCNASHPAYCNNMFAYNYATGRLSDGSSPVNGKDGERINACYLNQSSFATYAIADETNAVKAPKDVPLDILGPLGCGIQTGAGAAINSLKIQPGDTLAVFGGGAVGLSALLGALAVGAKSVTVVEPKESRRALALELGAAHVVDPAATPDVAEEVRKLNGGGVSHAIDTTGAVKVITTAADTLLNLGALGLVGVPALTDTLAISAVGVISRGLTIRGVVEGDAEPHVFIPQLIDLYRKGRFPFDRLIKRFPFDAINEAVASSLSGEAIKPLLVFDA
ncbi:MAG: NAD(P)-dependent alcohol dehydrogenase [Amphiplicatus sp.]